MSEGVLVAPRKLAQSEDEMFERNLAILVGTGQELEVVTSTDECYIGFAAGLDEEYLQMCASQDQQMVLVNRDYIVRLKGTGRALSDLPNGQESAIRAKCSTFQGVAAKHSHNQQRR